MASVDLEKAPQDPPPPTNASALTLVGDDSILPTPATEVDEDIFFGAVRTSSESTHIGSPDAKACQKPDLPADPPADPADPPSFIPPDGGTVAWCQVGAGALLNAIAWGTSMMFGIYQLHYTQTLGLDASAVSWIGSVQTFLTYFFSTVSGLLADAGYARHVTAAGTVLMVAGGLGTSFAAPAPTLAQSTLTQSTPTQSVPAALFICQALVTGLGLGLLTAPCLPSINGYFLRRRSVALAVSTLGTSAGGALLPAIVQFLLPAVGFGWAVRCATLLSLFFCLVAALLLRPPVKTAKTTKAASTPTSTPTSTSSIRASLSAFASHIVDWSALRELPFVLFLVGSFLLYWGLYFGFYYINVYAEDVVGFSTNQGTLLLIMSTALGMPSRVLAGAFADYIAGALDTLVVATVLLGATLLAWLAVGDSSAGMYVFVVAFGLCNGAVQSVWLGSIAALSGHAPGRIGARFGMVCVVAAVATLAGAPTASALIGNASLDLAASYHTAQIWAAATTLASAAMLAVVRVYFAGWRLRGRAGAK